MVTMPALAAGGTPNGRLMIGKAMPSVVSVAVNISVSAVKSVMENVTAPLFALDVPVAGEIMALALLEVSVTVLPLTVLPLASTRTTRTPPWEVPSAGTV